MHFDPMTLGIVLAGCLAFFIIALFIGDVADVSSGDGGFDVSGHDVDLSGDVQHGVTTSEIFTLRNAALLGIGFSGASLLAMRAGQGPLATNLWGGLAGCVLVALGIWLFRLVRRQESNSITSHQNLLEKTAVVTTTIPGDGFGEISLRNEQGTPTSLMAKSGDGNSIGAGIVVKITAIAGNLATVNVN